MKEHYVLAIDVAKGKSMVSLIGSCGEVLISPYEINHNLNDFKNLDESKPWNTPRSNGLPFPFDGPCVFIKCL